MNKEVKHIWFELLRDILCAVMIFLVVFLFFGSISGCSSFYRTNKFHAYADHGLFESVVYTELYNPDGTVMEGSGRLTLCNGYSGLITSLMQDAAIVGAAALIGGGLAESGNSITNNNSSNSTSKNSNSNYANARANSSANAKNLNAPTAPSHYVKPHQSSNVIPPKTDWHGKGFKPDSGSGQNSYPVLSPKQVDSFYH